MAPATRKAATSMTTCAVLVGAPERKADVGQVRLDEAGGEQGPDACFWRDHTAMGYFGDSKRQTFDSTKNKNAAFLLILIASRMLDLSGATYAPGVTVNRRWKSGDALSSRYRATTAPESALPVTVARLSTSCTGSLRVRAATANHRSIFMNFQRPCRFCGS